MTFVQQTVWGWLIAVYLFLGGLGGTVLSLSALTDLYLHKNTEHSRRPAIFGAISGFAALAVGTVFLLIDLLQPLAVIYSLLNPTSWIFWGVLFISLYFVFTVLYVLPYIKNWPLIKIFSKLITVIEKWQRAAGFLAAIMGLLVALYTGFLLSTAPAIPFWNTPALPILFLVSGSSTGSALLMFYLARLRRPDASEIRLLHFLERLDIILMSTEVLLLAAYFNYFRTSAEAGKVSANYLLSHGGFTFGFLTLGLILPLLLEIYIGYKGKQAAHTHLYQGEHALPNTRIETASASTHDSHISHRGLIQLATLLVLLGGFLLRWYVLTAGFYGYPFPS